MKSCDQHACSCHFDQSAVDVSEVDAMVARIGREADDLIPLLQAIQERWHWLAPAALERLCEITDIKPAAVTGVSTFYHLFRHEPVGRHIIKTCIGTACHVSGAESSMTRCVRISN
jgi:NADH:ubiquinone oxidoreductase subunit E